MKDIDLVALFSWLLLVFLYPVLKRLPSVEHMLLMSLSEVRRLYFLVLLMCVFIFCDSSMLFFIMSLSNKLKSGFVYIKHYSFLLWIAVLSRSFSLHGIFFLVWLSSVNCIIGILVSYYFESVHHLWNHGHSYMNSFSP